MAENAQSAARQHRIDADLDTLDDGGKRYEEVDTRLDRFVGHLVAPAESSGERQLRRVDGVDGLKRERRSEQESVDRDQAAARTWSARHARMFPACPFSRCRRFAHAAQRPSSAVGSVGTSGMEGV